MDRVKYLIGWAVALFVAIFILISFDEQATTEKQAVGITQSSPSIVTITVDRATRPVIKSEPTIQTSPTTIIMSSLSPIPPTATKVKQTALDSGTLRIHPENPRYLTDGSGKSILLVGSHHWDNLVDNDARPDAFNYSAYLDFLEKHNHNFIRMWAQWAWIREVNPVPYQRVGPESALDGKLKFDLTQFNQPYFDRLRSRIIEAGERGIYVSVMLFQGWSIEDRGEGNPWMYHPFNGANNINGIDGDLNGNGEGKEIHTLDSQAVTALQEAYVKKIVDTVNDLDNVIYEIANESHSDSVAWQYHMVEFIRNYEKGKPKQHLVGITSGGGDAISNDDIFASPADWVSPNFRDGYKDNPPAADGSKVVVADTDHIFGIGGDRIWVWKSFLRGLHIIYMDDFGPEPWKEEARQALGDVLTYSNRINLAAMKPHNNLASTKYCLANPEGSEYLVYLPDGGTVTVDLRVSQGKLQVEWFDPRRGVVVTRSITTGGSRQSLTAPFPGDAVLYIYGESAGSAGGS